MSRYFRLEFVMYEAFIVCLRSSSSITDRQAFHNLQKHSDT